MLTYTLSTIEEFFNLVSTLDQVDISQENVRIKIKETGDVYKTVKSGSGLFAKKCKETGIWITENIKDIQERYKNRDNKKASTFLNFLSEFAPDFPNVKEKLLSNTQTDLKNKFRIINGDPQLKKSWLVNACVLHYLIEEKMSSIIVVQNLNEAMRQFVSRSKEIFESWKDLDFENDFIVLDIERGKFVREEDFEGAISGAIPRIFICLRNESDMKPLNDMLDTIKDDNVKFSLFVDECDMLDSDKEECKAQIELDRLKEHSTFY